MEEKAPGWYVDERGDLRWWDGSGWTGHAHSPSDEADAVAGAGSADDPARAVQASAAGGTGRAGVALAESSAAPHTHGADDAARSSKERSRRRWIVWGSLIAGGLVIGGILAVVIPAILGFFADSAEERAAAAAVQGYDAAWAEADCAELEASTTVGLREFLGYTDCALFEADAQIFRDSVQDYEQRVTNTTKRDDGAYEVRTEESYLNLIGPEGEPLAEPEPFLYRYTYVVVPEGDGWVIDDFYSEDLQSE